MKKGWLPTNPRGFSVVEAILASALFTLFATTFVGMYLYGQESTVFAGNRIRAAMLAQEGIEAVRNIGDASFSNLNNGTYGLAVSGGEWIFSGSSDMTDIFTRTITITSVNADTKNITSAVSWQQNAQRSGAVSFVTELSQWASISGSCGDYAVSEGYGLGTCRANEAQCGSNAEVYLSEGDAFCTDGPSADTCCGLPVEPSPTLCDTYAASLGYVSGTCRQNVNQCGNNGEDHLVEGDAFCTDGPSADTCCGLP